MSNSNSPQWHIVIKNDESKQRVRSTELAGQAGVTTENEEDLVVCIVKRII